MRIEKIAKEYYVANFRGLYGYGRTSFLAVKEILDQLFLWQYDWFLDPAMQQYDQEDMTGPVLGEDR